MRNDRGDSVFYLYPMLDVWSRKIVGSCGDDAEYTHIASELLESGLTNEGHEGKNLVLHSAPTVAPGRARP